MNIQDLGSLGEFIAAVAVVVSLAYVAVQIRQNTRASRAETVQHLTSSYISILNGLVLNSESTRLLIAGLRSWDELNEEDRIRFSLLMYSVFTAFQNAFHQRRYGTLEDELFEPWHRQLTLYTRRPGVVAWWAYSQSHFTDAFREFVNELMTSGKGSAN